MEWKLAHSPDYDCLNMKHHCMSLSSIGRQQLFSPNNYRKKIKLEIKRQSLSLHHWKHYYELSLQNHRKEQAKRTHIL